MRTTFGRQTEGRKEKIEVPGVDGWIILEFILRKQGGKMWTVFI
jgi:hypothetical protein